MTHNADKLTPSEAKGLRTAKELEGHLVWLDTLTSAALGVLAIASGIYTYLGVSSLLEDTGVMSFFAADGAPLQRAQVGLGGLRIGEKRVDRHVFAAVEVDHPSAASLASAQGSEAQLSDAARSRNFIA